MKDEKCRLLRHLSLSMQKSLKFNEKLLGLQENLDDCQISEFLFNISDYFIF